MGRPSLLLEQEQSMNKRCAGLVVVLVSLLAFGVANAEIEFGAVLDPRIYVIRVDSASFTPPDTTFLTTGWGTDTPYDTFVFAGVPAWPETLRLHGNLQGFAFHLTYLYPDTGRWYHIGSSGKGPFVKFYGTGYGGVEESKPVVAPPPRLTVSPSVVTGQMSVRLRPAGISRPVVEIHDAVGNVVRSLGCTAGRDGVATATWNREDDHGRLVPKGVYFCRYAEADIIAVRKVLVAH
jgi:hypothetical protein